MIKAFFKVIFVTVVLVCVTLPKLPILLFFMIAGCGGSLRAQELTKKILLWPIPWKWFDDWTN